MIEEVSTTWRTARKAHTCNYCRGTIQPGEQYERYVGKQDGDLYTFLAHEKCVFIAREIWDFVDPDDGMDDDAFCEGCSEVCRTFVCPDCGKWDTDECDESYCMDKLYDFLMKYELHSIREKTYLRVWKCRERTKA